MRAHSIDSRYAFRPIRLKSAMSSAHRFHESHASSERCGSRSAAWSAVVAGRLTQDGAGTALLGALYAICEISRLPAALLLPAVTLHYGARRVTQGGLMILLVLPLIALSGLGNGQVMLIFILS